MVTSHVWQMWTKNTVNKYCPVLKEDSLPTVDGEKFQCKQETGGEEAGLKLQFKGYAYRWTLQGFMHRGSLNCAGVVAWLGCFPLGANAFGSVLHPDVSCQNFQNRGWVFAYLCERPDLLTASSKLHEGSLAGCYRLWRQQPKVPKALLRDRRMIRARWVYS